MRIMNMFASEGAKGLDHNCLKCRLHEKCLSPQLPYSGKGNMEILIIYDHPTKAEDETKIHLSGEAGNFLKRELTKMGLRLYDDFWITSIVQCSSGAKSPSDKQISMCHDNLMDTIKELNPRFIWTLGSAATKAVTEKALKRVVIGSTCNLHIPLKKHDAWLFPLYNPSFVLGNKYDGNLKGFFRRNLKMIMDFMKEDPELPTLDPFNNIEILTNSDDILYKIGNLINNKEVSAFDFETTGLDPWYPGHNITSMAIATKDTSFAFPIEHPDGLDPCYIDDVMDIVSEYVNDPNLIKIGQSVNFDINWVEWLVDNRDPHRWKSDWEHDLPQGVFPCTLNTSHILDHRSGNNGLKDQAFIRWGIVNYDSATDSYIKSAPGKKFNRMMEMPLKSQLLYVGADARLTMQLYLEQQQEMIEGQKKANRFFINGLEVLRNIQNNGIIVDVDYYEKVYEDLGNQIKEIVHKINTSKDAEAYEIKYKDPFLYTSPKVLKRLLFEMREIKPVKYTEKGNAAVDEEALRKLDYWMCELIVKLRKLEKLRGTYIKQYIKSQVDGVIHPTFKLDIATSFRSSCVYPNTQNTPKRNKDAKNLVRKGFITPKGWKVFEVDFDGMEVSTSAMYHKDPNFMKYLTTPGTDMHRDNTCDLWICKPEQVTKMMRFFGKNKWTFAQFYGDYFGSCGVGVWKSCIEEDKLVMADGVPLINHINSMGIHELGEIVKGKPTPGSFLEHCKKVEHKMWYERFGVYTQWKKDINNFYNEHGYIESLLGFRYDGYMDRKQTTNYLVQGTAFHLLLWCLWKLDIILREEGWRSYLVGEVHDSMMGYVHPDEEQDLWQLFTQICTVEVIKRFDFINVPLSITIEASETNGNFANLTEVDMS